MQTSLQWKNKSVLAFAPDDDPVAKMERVAQGKVLDAMGQGWSGPPFDPLELANLMGIQVRPNASVPDARIVLVGETRVIEFNPNKSVGRVNFSIAHEIAHTFFEDWHERPRNRARESGAGQNWQLEMLCNIGAAEILMPLGTFGHDQGGSVSITEVLELRREFNVSAEAVLIRLAKMSKTPLLAFAASRLPGEGGPRYRIDYSRPSANWSEGRPDGLILGRSDALSQCVAIGNTATAQERWEGLGSEVEVQAVGLPPYPGTAEMRYAGFIRPSRDAEISIKAHIEFRYGDASVPVFGNAVAIVHVVNDKARRWGGGGFSRSLYRTFPEAAEDYTAWTAAGDEFRLGAFHAYLNSANQAVISIVAQRGYGPSPAPRIRYSALHSALNAASGFLLENGIDTAQMPRIGSGQAGGNWKFIEGMIYEELVLKGIDVKVFDFPPR